METKIIPSHVSSQSPLSADIVCAPTMLAFFSSFNNQLYFLFRHRLLHLLVSLSGILFLAHCDLVDCCLVVMSPLNYCCLLDVSLFMHSEDLNEVVISYFCVSLIILSFHPYVSRRPDGSVHHCTFIV